jgi:O-acetylserine/cysteine efflux transporter
VVGGLAAEGAPPAAGAREAALVGALAVLGSALPLGLFYVALTHAPAAEVSAWFFLVPVIGVGTAWPLLGEAPDAALAAGMTAVAAGLWMVLGERDRPQGRLVDSTAPP